MSGFHERLNVTPLFWGERAEQQEVKEIQKVNCIKKPKGFYESVFDDTFLEVNQYNESDELNPVYYIEIVTIQ